MTSSSEQPLFIRNLLPTRNKNGKKKGGEKKKKRSSVSYNYIQVPVRRLTELLFSLVFYFLCLSLLLFGSYPSPVSIQFFFFFALVAEYNFITCVFFFCLFFDFSSSYHRHSANAFGLVCSPPPTAASQLRGCKVAKNVFLRTCARIGKLFSIQSGMNCTSTLLSSELSANAWINMMQRMGRGAREKQTKGREIR